VDRGRAPDASDTRDREQKGEEGGIHAAAGICAAVGRRTAKSRDARTLGSAGSCELFELACESSAV
jgi:hypothetical protein